MTRLPLAVVVACNQDWIIGAKGGMPWHIPEDLRHFKRVTMDHAILMGRKTHESIGVPLPGRRNIVITRQKQAHFEGCETAGSLSEAIDMARAGGDDCPRIIGGGQIYAEAPPMATDLYLTQIQIDVEGDTTFPEVNFDEWTLVHSRDGRRDGVRFLHLRRD